MRIILAAVAVLLSTLLALANAEEEKKAMAWQKRIDIDAGTIATEKDLKTRLDKEGLSYSKPANWYTGRWPNISFIGGMAMGNRSEDLEFFYEKPFKWWTEVLDYVMQDGGKKYGIRARIWRYKEIGSSVGGWRSYLLTVRTDTLQKDYHPSYILANGRRIWDARKHPLQPGKLVVPFSLEEATDPIIDFVVDKEYTPEVKGLAFRNFFVHYLGDRGVKVDYKDAADKPEGSPADQLERFAFGLFPCGYEFWSDRGPTFAEIKKNWKPNFRPTYALDDLGLCPVVFHLEGKGKYHDFMLTYGGCNILGNNPDPEFAKAHAAHIRGALVSPRPRVVGADVLEDNAKTVLNFGPNFEVHWMQGESGSSPEDLKMVQEAKKATGQPERVKRLYEPFSPSLAHAREYERGTDVLIFKNEEDPQYNIMMAMGRGAGRTYDKPFGFYWEQTHYPYPSMEFKLQACLLYYFSGGSWIGAEAERAPAFEKEIVAEWVLPYVQALRLAMVHPARGKPIVPIGILWDDDRWWVPYNCLGEMDTFQRHMEYDHATKTLKCEPAFTRVLPWMPQDRSKWNFQTTGHLNHFIDKLPQLKGYDLLDVFFPEYGDAFTARIARLLTGTPHGSLDFVYTQKATVAQLKSYGMLAVLGEAIIRGTVEEKLSEAVQAGTPLLFGAQHAPRGADGKFAHKPFGLELLPAAAVEGKISGAPEIFKTAAGNFSGKVHGFKGEGWEVVAKAGQTPLLVRKSLLKGAVYIYLGEWMYEGGATLRPLLAAMGQKAAPLQFAPLDDQLEYVTYRKGAGAWAAIFNHGAIPVGCDRLKELRAIPPEPLVSKVKGPWKGQLEFRLDRLSLDPSGNYALYHVAGIDQKSFEGVISGHETFKVHEIPAKLENGLLRAEVEIGTRAQYLIAPKGQGEAVFFGKP